MRIILAILTLIGLPAFSQTITGAAIQPGGWDLWLYVTGVNTAGTYNIGFTTNNVLAETNSIRLEAVSQGYNDDGTTNQTTLKIVGTAPLRIPGTSTNDETLTASGIILKFGLSKAVSQFESAISLTTLAGLYSQGGSNLTAVTGLSVTNLSTQLYPEVVGNWVWPGFQHIQSSIVTQRFVAFHPSARLGRPVRAVRFSATDGTNTAVAWSYKPTVEWDFGEAKPVPRYVGVLDLSVFPQPNFVKFDAAAFPWRGNTNAVLDTATLGHVFPDYRPCPVTNLIDSAGAYRIVRAVVATNGVNATGVAANPTYWATNQSPPAFLSIGAAMTAIAGTNNAQHSHNDLTAGIVKFNEGRHTWLDSACTITAGPRIFTVLEPNTGASRDNVVIAAQATDTRCTDDRDLFLFRNLTFDTSGALFVRENVWMDQCVILNATSSSFYQAPGPQNVWYITRSVISNVTQGLRSFTTQRLAPALVLGNRIVGNTATIHGLLVLGNIKERDASTQARVVSGFVGGLLEKGPQIIAYNEFYNLRFMGDILEIGGDSNVVRGIVIANNLFEQTTNNTASTAYNIGSVSRSVTNVMCWNNTFVGTKVFYGYNDSGSVAYYRWLWSTYNNVWDDFNLKGDEFTTVNTNRVGNWPVSWGADSFGNAMLETENVGAPGAFLPEFPGTSGWFPTGTLTTNYPMFWNRLAHDGYNTMPGGGDYRLLSKSPLHIRNQSGDRDDQWVLSHDLNGIGRGISDPPGAYSSGNVRKGWFE